MAEAAMDTDPDLLEAYSQTPLMALRMTSRKKLAQYLNQDGTSSVCGKFETSNNNYIGLAELIGFAYKDIKNFMKEKSPTEELLEAWTMKGHLHPTIGSLWRFLLMMKRFDVVTDCKNCILNDAQVYAEIKKFEKVDLPIQDQEVSPSGMIVDETKYVTVDDVNNQPEGEQLYYDAFVCYNPEREDLHFVKYMIRMLESSRHNIKLFVPGRDDLPGSSQHTINAYLIEKRCRRILIIMSKAFQESAACEFHVKFAHALEPGARSKKLIPIILDRRYERPRILNFLTSCDFTRDDMEDWEWFRLASAIKAPIDYMSQEEKFNDTEKLKDIDLGKKDRFEKSWRQDDIEETTMGSQSSQSEAVYRRPTSSGSDPATSVAPENQLLHPQPCSGKQKTSHVSSSTDGSVDDKDKDYKALNLLEIPFINKR